MSIRTRQNARRRRDDRPFRLTLEPLEPRRMLAGGVFITEFMAENGYLALTDPAGQSHQVIADYPFQVADVSFGLAADEFQATLVTAGEVANVLVPANTSELPPEWNTADFDDSTWAAAPNGRPAVRFAADHLGTGDTYEFNFGANAGGSTNPPIRTGPNGWDIIFAVNRGDADSELYVNSPTATHYAPGQLGNPASEDYSLFYRMTSGTSEAFLGVVADASHFAGTVETIGLTPYAHLLRPGPGGRVPRHCGRRRNRARRGSPGPAAGQRRGRHRHSRRSARAAEPGIDRRST